MYTKPKFKCNIPVLVDDNSMRVAIHKIKEINLLIKDYDLYISVDEDDIKLTDYSSGFFDVITKGIKKSYPQLTEILFPKKN